MVRFVASNGAHVYRGGNGQLCVKSATEDAFDVRSIAAPHEQALREYFAQEPKPWEEAKAGEVWALTIGGDEAAFTFSEGEFWPQYRKAVPLGLFELQAITAGRRIWPEEAQS